MLSGKQEAFCQEYVATDDPRAAYRSAYNADGSSAETVRKRAQELLKNGAIAGRIQQLRDEIHRARAVAANLLTAEYLNIALADVTTFLEAGDDGRLKLVDVKSLDPWTRRQLKRITLKPDGGRCRNRGSSPNSLKIAAFGRWRPHSS